MSTTTDLERQGESEHTAAIKITAAELDEYLAKMAEEADYTLSFLSYSAVFTKSRRNAFLRFCRWVDEHHGPESKEFQNAMDLARNDTPRIRDVASQMYYVLLKKGSKVVCVGTLRGSGELSTITTPKEERGKGYATKMMTSFRELLERFGANCLCPAETRVLGLLAKAGWTPADNVRSPDGTLDTMPEFVKTDYARAVRMSKSVVEYTIDQNTRLMRHILMSSTITAPEV